MRENTFLVLMLTIFSVLSVQAQDYDRLNTGDWLINADHNQARVIQTEDAIILYNGLLKRSFYLGENLACFDFKNLSNGEQLIRSIKPEAKLFIDQKEYVVGGLHGQKENAYILPEWLRDMKAGKDDFVFSHHTIAEIEPFVQWKAHTWIAPHKAAGGKILSLHFKPGAEELKGLEVVVHYELYDGIPLVVKWLSVENKSDKEFLLKRVVNEVLGMVEEESAVVGSPDEMKKPQGIYIETNYAFNNSMRYDLSDQTTHWKTDSSYTSQVNYNYETPCLLEVYPKTDPYYVLKPGDTFKSVRTHELLLDSYDRQRRGLMIKKMYRTVAPWIMQNPIFMHLISKNDGEVRAAIDQCVATGYEAVILSFGSHIDMEDSSDENITRWKELVDYAHERGVLLGGYSLFSSRRISDEHDVISPITGKPGGAFFGNAPCFGSQWGLEYSDKIKYFFEQTGFDIWENDGPYPGDVCASTTHPGHTGLEDSQWKQMEIQKELYRWLNERGVYINAPDWYFLDGTHKIGIGYREVNFSLSREQQRILNRQNIYDGTIEKTGSMGWGFVPLTYYQGGGPDAILEPLSEHLKDYEQLMVQYYGAGVQAAYRGPRLYDTEATRRVVVNTVDWYKRYRDILNSDMIHLRRADGRDWDGLVHVNPDLKEKGFILLYNPTGETITRSIQVPLYYTGLTKKARLREMGGKTKTYQLNRAYEISLQFSIEPEGYQWWVVE